VLVDANILLYSIDLTSPFHPAADQWLTAALNGTRRVGLPWMSLMAFVRIATNPRAARRPLTPAEAWSHVEGWLDAPAAWIPEPGREHRAILGELLTRLDLRAGLVTDAVLAALCIEHGLSIVSADSDFARFTGLTWINPVAAPTR
jgi:toxin-antitoxin system PIN domain toxin